MRQLIDTLRHIDGQGYKSYKGIKGDHQFDGFLLRVDHVQADPFAAPSRFRAFINWSDAGLTPECRSTETRARAARDYLARCFRQAAAQEEAIRIDAGKQCVLDRTAVLFDDQGIEVRFTVSLPARGRTILGKKAERLIGEALPVIIRGATQARYVNEERLLKHCECVEDQVALRTQLKEIDCVAFIGDHSVLARRSGIDDRPLEDAIAFQAPDSLAVTLQAPNAGPIRGMRIKKGVTLIVGGGFHGKSTLLNALQLGVYDHCPGDGRETVVTDACAMKIRAEDGRSVVEVDLSPYINQLPYGRSTDRFSTELASGSTSQAAALQEALECGSQTLLVDEDTSATNFMIRDKRMQTLVAKTHEPITPFVDRVRELRDQLGISTILVMGGSGDYFEYADEVIQMRDYIPLDVTEQAKEIALTHPTGRREESHAPLTRAPVRRLQTDTLDPTVHRGKRKVQSRGLDTLIFGTQTVDLRSVEQIVDPSQVRAIGMFLTRLGEAGGMIDDPSGWFRHCLEEGDWKSMAERPSGDLVRPRVAEIMAALNRLRQVGFTND